MRILLAVAVVLSLSSCTGHAANDATPSPTPVVASPSSSPSAPVQGSATPTPSAARATRTVVLRPVTASGVAAPGYSVASEPQDPVDCSTPTASPVALDDGVAWCFPTAAYAVACWHRPGAGSVLCFRNPWKHQLVRLPLASAFPRVAAPARPQPLGLVLDDGEQCSMRDGGAWSPREGHPTWHGSYGCDKGVLWAPTDSSDGLDRSAPLWRVVEGDISGHGALSTRHVLVAFFLANAR